MTKEFNFVVVNARRSVNAVQKALRESIAAAIPSLTSGSVSAEPNALEPATPEPA